jgi:hypothetical protein
VSSGQGLTTRAGSSCVQEEDEALKAALALSMQTSPDAPPPAPKVRRPPQITGMTYTCWDGHVSDGSGHPWIVYAVRELVIS